MKKPGFPAAVYSINKEMFIRGNVMGTILENLHRFHIKTAVDDLKENGNPHINEDHKLNCVFRCRLCGYVYDEAKEGKPFSSIPHCPKCGAVLLAFEEL